jgi:DNA-binding beta-propeller fold protein YncE
LAVGSDGTLFFLASEYLRRLDPATGSIQNLEFGEIRITDASYGADIAIGVEDRLYILIPEYHYVQIRKKSGELISTISDDWSNPGSEPGRFQYPQGIAASVSGEIFVADSGNNRIQVFTPDGVFSRQWSALRTDE